jgi:hypothetical protein
MKYKLTVIMRDDGPMFYANDCPSYRKVVLELTEEQNSQIVCREVGNDFRESISQAIIEEVKP